jgi:hypothetical protein
MSTFIAAVVYGSFAVGYVAMIVLIDCSAGRLVRGEIRERHPSTTIVTTLPTRPVASIAPAFARLMPPAA